MDFNASIGSTAKIMTGFIIALLVFVGVLAFDADDPARLLFIPVLPGLLIFGLSYFFSIRKYTITDDEIIIWRPLDKVTCKRSAIKTVEPVLKKNLRFTIRTFGIGGIFAFTGDFWNRKYGSMTWYVTRTDSAVMLHTIKGKKIVVSPDDRDAFLAAFRRSE